MNLQEAMDWALENTPRNPDGGLDQGAVLAAAETRLDSELSYRERAVKGELNRRKRKGQTPADGQICLPGMEAFAYEPDRLIADDDKQVIEQSKATPHYTAAEAERALRKAEQALRLAKVKGVLNSRFAQWAYAQMEQRRPAVEITYDAWVREAGIWSAEDAPPEDEGDEDET